MLLSTRLKSLALAAMILGTHAYADNMIRMQAPIAHAAGKWVAASPLLGDWSEVSRDCTDWTPDPLLQPYASTFDQSLTCLVTQKRSVQDRQVNEASGQVRNVGIPYFGTQTKDDVQTRQASWIVLSPLVGPETTSAPSCGDWSPDASTVIVGTQFTQTRTCATTYTSQSQGREQLSLDDSIRNTGASQTLSRTTQTSETQAAGGTKPDPNQWVSADPVVSQWSETSRSCADWTPDPYAQAYGSTFTQTQLCKVTQAQTVQDRQHNLYDDTYKDVGASYTQSQTVDQTQSRSESWKALAAVVSAETEASRTCAAWTPDATTVAHGQAFTQTRTCQVTMSSSSQGREQLSLDGSIRNTGAAAPLSRVVAATETQSAVGTKPDAVAFSIVNPVAGQSGIYSINDGAGGTFKAYVNMALNGGKWIQIAYWTTSTSGTSEPDRSFADLTQYGAALNGYTQDPTGHPIIPKGTLNKSTSVMYVSSHPNWVSAFGGWVSFNTFASGTVIGTAGFPITAASGSTTKLFAQVNGWNTTAPMSSVFGLWTAYGPNGTCGGVNIVAPVKMCPTLQNTTNTNHFDYSYVKSLYLKASS